MGHFCTTFHLSHLNTFLVALEVCKNQNCNGPHSNMYLDISTLRRRSSLYAMGNQVVDENLMIFTSSTFKFDF